MEAEAGRDKLNLLMLASSQMRKTSKTNHLIKEVSEILPNDIYFASLVLVTYSPAPIVFLYLHGKRLILHIWNFTAL